MVKVKTIYDVNDKGNFYIQFNLISNLISSHRFALILCGHLLFSRYTNILISLNNFLQNPKIHDRVDILEVNKVLKCCFLVSFLVAVIQYSDKGI